MIWAQKLDQSRRRWTKVKTTLVQCVLFTGICWYISWQPHIAKTWVVVLFHYGADQQRLSTHGANYGNNILLTEWRLNWRCLGEDGTMLAQITPLSVYRLRDESLPNLRYSLLCHGCGLWLKLISRRCFCWLIGHMQPWKLISITIEAIRCSK